MPPSAALAGRGGGVSGMPGIGKALAADPKPAASGAPPTASHPHWSYEGAGGPEHWGKLEPQFRVCDLGIEQTPIDLTGGIKAELGGLQPAFAEMPLTIVNNGRSTARPAATP